MRVKAIFQSGMTVSVLALILISPSAAEYTDNLSRDGKIPKHADSTGSHSSVFYTPSSDAPYNAPMIAPRFDTTVTLTILRGDTTKTLTIREQDPARGIDKSLKGIFTVQLFLLVASIVSTVTLIIASN
jgi:hypothetical protein